LIDNLIKLNTDICQPLLNSSKAMQQSISTSAHEQALIALRGRVINFEKEMHEKITVFQPSIEQDVKELTQLRNQWVDTIVSIDKSDYESYHKRIEILKIRLDSLSLELLIDAVRLDGIYESATLNYLVESTAPMEGSETLEGRNKRLMEVTKVQSEDLTARILSCEEYRAQLKATAYDIQFELQRIQLEAESHFAVIMGLVEDRLQTFTSKLSDLLSTAEANSKKVMSDYLILRHNARVAREILHRSQKDATSAREDLERRLDQIVQEASLQRDKMSAASMAEINLITDDIRQTVLTKESELESMEKRVDIAKRQSSFEIRSLKKEIKLYNKKYKELQKQRANDHGSIREELTKLRDLIAAAELSM
jgi:hypothetical protein